MATTELQVHVLPVSAQKRASLVNRLAQAKADLDAAQARYDQLKTEALCLLGEGSYSSGKFQLDIKLITGTRLDIKQAKSYLTQAQLDSCSVDNEYFRFYFKGVA